MDSENLSFQRKFEEALAEFYSFLKQMEERYRAEIGLVLALEAAGREDRRNRVQEAEEVCGAAERKSCA